MRNPMMGSCQGAIFGKDPMSLYTANQIIFVLPLQRIFIWSTWTGKWLIRLKGTWLDDSHSGSAKYPIFKQIVLLAADLWSSRFVCVPVGKSRELQQRATTWIVPVNLL